MGFSNWAKHANTSETMDALGVGSHQLKGHDFAQNFPGAARTIGPALARGYQYGQELGRSVLDGPGGYTMGQAWDEAGRQSDANIQGMQGKGFNRNMYNNFIAEQQALGNKPQGLGSIIKNALRMNQAQASIPTRDDMIKASIQKQMINEGTATPMARRTYGDMSMGQGRPDWVADRSPVQQGLKSIEIGMAPEIKEAIYQDRIMNPNLPRFASQPQYRIRDQLKRDFLQGGLWKDAKQSLGQTRDSLFEDFQGLGSLKDRVVNSATGLWDKIGGGVETIMDNTLIGRIAAMNDATNPRAWNYNPGLQSQIDFMNEQGMYGKNPNSGLNQITGGVLAGKNLQSLFGSNDLGTMYDKSIAQTQKVIDNFANQWSKLKEEDPDEYNKKLAWHQNKLAKKKKEQDIFTANQKKITDANIAAEKALSQSYNIGQRGGGAGDSSTSHMGGISQAQADAVGKANKEAGMSGWGLKEGGIASLWRR